VALKAKKASEPSGPSVPAYIVTFSDMVTLLLTFFVMLLSLAQVQDPELFEKSRDAFNQHINQYGLGLLMGKQPVPELGNNKTVYHIPDPDNKSSARTIDSKEETLRRLFQKAAKSMEAMPSRVGVRLSDYYPTSIHFSQGQTGVDEAAGKYLTQLAAQFRQQAGSAKIELYVLGLAPDEVTEKQQWVMSSLRAQQVADYLAQTGFQCPIYSWGGGPGGHWVDQDSSVSKDSQILIALVRLDS
jgi:chemotaxis protein MotB